VPVLSVRSEWAVHFAFEDDAPIMAAHFDAVPFPRKTEFPPQHAVIGRRQSVSVAADFCRSPYHIGMEDVMTADAATRAAWKAIQRLYALKKLVVDEVLIDSRGQVSLTTASRARISSISNWQ
jgi:hypothetical protein